MSLNKIQSTVAPAFSGKVPGSSSLDDVFYEPTLSESVQWQDEDIPDVLNAPIFIEIDGRTVPDRDFRKNFAPWLTQFFRRVFAHKGIRAMSMSREVLAHDPNKLFHQQIVIEEDEIGSTLYNELELRDLELIMQANKLLFDEYVGLIMKKFDECGFFGQLGDDRGGNYTHYVRNIIVDSIKEALLLNLKAAEYSTPNY